MVRNVQRSFLNRGLLRACRIIATFSGCISGCEIFALLLRVVRTTAGVLPVEEDFHMFVTGNLWLSLRLTPRSQIQSFVSKTLKAVSVVETFTAAERGRRKGKQGAWGKVEGDGFCGLGKG